MLTITFTNGDIQNVKVTGDFFSVTLAEKNTDAGIKKIKVTPIEKAEDFAHDLAVTRQSLVSSISLIYPGAKQPKLKTFRPMDDREPEENPKAGPSYIRELKALKKEWRHKKHTNRWVWNF